MFDGVVVIKREKGCIFNIGGKNDAFLPAEEVDDYEQSFTGTLQEFGERLSYGDFFQEDIKESIKEFEADKTKQGHLSGRKYDSIAYEIKQN